MAGEMNSIIRSLAVFSGNNENYNIALRLNTIFVYNNCHVICAHVPPTRYEQQRYSLHEETRFTANF
jgi:hypothetical protein